jgi:hypothetical protein
MSAVHQLRLGWSRTTRVQRCAPASSVAVTFDVGEGDVHAVPVHEDYALCGAHIVWPDRPSRPVATALPDHACSSCRDVLPVFGLLSGVTR